MGKKKYLEEIEQYIAKSPVVSFSSIQKKINAQKKVKQYPKQLIRNLIKKNKLQLLTKGYYTAFNEISLSVFCFSPAYLGLQDALSYHHLWEQETIPIILTARKARTGIRKVMGQNILIRHLDSKYYFGIEFSKQNKFALPYSDLEKTLIDLVHFKQPIDLEVKKGFKRRIDIGKLNDYLKKYPSLLRKKVMKVIS